MGVPRVISGIDWSPDGRQIAYAVWARNSGGKTAASRASLWVASRDGRLRHLVARRVGEPAWARIILPRSD